MIITKAKFILTKSSRLINRYINLFSHDYMLLTLTHNLSTRAYCTTKQLSKINKDKINNDLYLFLLRPNAFLHKQTKFSFDCNLEIRINKSGKRFFQTALSISNKGDKQLESIQSLIQELSTLKPKDQRTMVHLKFLIPKILNHPSLHEFDKHQFHLLIQKSIELKEPMFIGSILVKTMFMSIILDHYSYLLAIQNCRADFPDLVYRVTKFCFSNKDFKLGIIDLNIWFVGCLQDFSLSDQLNFYFKAKKLLGASKPSVGVYRLMLESLIKQRQKIYLKEHSGLLAQVNLFLADLKLSGYMDRIEIFNLYLKFNRHIKPLEFFTKAFDQLLGQGPAPDGETLLIMNYVAAYHKDIKKISNLAEFNYKSSLIANQSILESLLQGFVDAKELGLAKDLFMDSFKNSLPSTLAFKILLEGHSKVGDLGFAMKLYSKMLLNDIPLSSFIGHQLISGFINDNQLPMACKLMEHLEKNDVAIEPETIGALMHCACKLKEWDTILLLYHASLLQRTFQPSPKIFTALFKACSETNDSKGLSQLFQDLGSFLLTPIASKYLLEDYLELLKLLATLESKEAIESVFYSLKMFFYLNTPEAYNCMLQFYTNNNDLVGANLIFKDLTQDRIQPNNQSYKLLIKLNASKGNVMAIKKLYRKIRENKYEPDAETLSCMITAHIKCQDYKVAIEVAEAILEKGDGIDKKVFENVIGVYLINPDEKSLDLILSRIINSKLIPTSKTYLEVIKLFLDQDRLDKAKLLIEHMKTNITTNTDIWNLFIEYYLRHDNTIDALNILNRKLKPLNLTPNSTTLSLFVSYYTTKNKEIETQRWMDKMFELGLRPSTQLCNQALKVLIDRSDYTTVLNIYDSMIWAQIPISTHTVTIIGLFLLKYNRYDDLLSLFLSLVGHKDLAPEQEFLDALLKMNDYTEFPAYFWPELMELIKKCRWKASNRFLEHINKLGKKQ